MRLSVLALISLLAVPACHSQDAATPPVAPAMPAAPAGPAMPPAPPIPPTSSWTLDPENSSVTFDCKHVFTHVRGLFAKPSGTISLDDTTPANSKINASVDVNGITTGVEERDTHLKSADFFETSKFPTITFVSTSVSKSSPTSYAVTGNLTMHGVTKPVTLAVRASPPFNHAGGIRRGIEATSTVNRRDFGINWDFPGEASGVVVGDNILITIDAELVLQADAGKGG